MLTGREISLAPFSAAFVTSALAFAKFSALFAQTFNCTSARSSATIKILNSKHVLHLDPKKFVVRFIWMQRHVHRL